MSDPGGHTPLYDYGLIAGFAAGLVATGNWLWKKVRPDEAPLRAVAPFDVREEVVASRIEVRLLLEKLRQDHELFLQEERSIHSQILSHFVAMESSFQRIQDQLSTITLMNAKDRG